MLRFNTFRAKRYLRSKFVEGKYLLASEATDLELELLDLTRKAIEKNFGSAVAVDDAWKIQFLSPTQVLVSPGEAWVKGLPFDLRFGKDENTSGSILTLGIVPVGVSVADSSTGLGKVLTFNDGSTTPTNNYRIVITAKEQLLTEVEDPFLQNANLTESTAQKIRLLFQINVVPVTVQTESPTPYKDENSSALVATNFPNAGGFGNPNLTNQIVVTPTAAGNGELVNTTLISGSEKIDGRDVEITLRNDSSIGGGHPMPKAPTEQQAFSNGTLYDSNGSKYHINAIFNDTVSTQIVLRLDKEPGQLNPEIINTKPFTLVKREVFVTDDVNGIPQGKLYWPVADLDWNSSSGVVHPSRITDKRNIMSAQDMHQKDVENKFDLMLTDGGTITWNSTTNSLVWSSAFKLINPHGPQQTIAAGNAPLVDGGSLSYDMDMNNGGAIQRGTLAISVTAFGATSTLAAVVLTTARVGNIVKDSGGTVAVITAIDDVNNTITTSPALAANGAATIFKDSYGPGYVARDIHSYSLVARSGTKVYIGGMLELENGEGSSIGDGVSQQLLTYIGATDETDSDPLYTSTNIVTQGQNLTAAISALDGATFGIGSGSDQDRNLKLVRGGNWLWAAPTLSWSSDAYIQVAGLPEARNRIPAGSIPLPLDGDCAYVIINRTAGAPATLTVLVANIASISGSNSVIIARRFGGSAVINSQTVHSAGDALDGGGSSSALGNPIVIAAPTTITNIEVLLTKLGTPSGNITVSLQGDSAGDPDGIPLGSASIAVSSIATNPGETSLNITTSIPVIAGTYHIVVESDATYKASFSIFGTFVSVKRDSTTTTPPLEEYFNGSVWAHASMGALYYVVTAGAGASTVVVGSHSFSLTSGESKELDAGLSIQNRAYIGTPDEAASAPSYSSSLRGVAGQSLLNRIGVLTDAMADSQEDRSAYLRSDLPVTWTGVQLQFTQNIILEILNTRTGTTTQHTILVAASPIALSNGQSAWVSIDRSLASENLTVMTSAIPAQTQANKDVFIIGKRVDANGAGYLHLPLLKQVFEPGQTARLGASGTGDGGSGVGDDLNSINFKASFSDDFKKLPDATIPINFTAGFTDQNTYSVVDQYYRLAYDATKTVTGTGTAMTISAAPSFTIKAGDILRVGPEVRKIASISSQTSVTLESSFSVDPSAAAVLVSQALHTKDLNNFSGDGLSPASVFSDNVASMLLFYRDTSTLDDIIQDNGVTPHVAYSASANGSTFTNMGVRTTNLSDKAGVSGVSPAGPNLFLRFFANKSSGSGFVNLLDYKVFFHSENAEESASGQKKYAYTRTDSIGSQINCSLSTTVTGKTRVKLLNGFFYPAGRLNGGSIKVRINGQKVPLFIDSTTTPDASWIPVDSQTLDLDSDYSGVSLGLEIELDPIIIDSSADNSAAIVSFAEVFEDKFQNSIDNDDNRLTPVNGSITVGQFRSNILGRASIPDLTQDLLPRMGINRIPTQSLIQLPNEQGPNGEKVFKTPNDFSDQIRFVGEWSTILDTNGTRANSTSINDYVEVVFYGTGLNILTLSQTTDLRATVDGNAEGSNIFPASSYSVLNGFNYAPNVVMRAASGLSLGVHTVKLRLAAAAMVFYGFEIVTESSQLQIPPGSAFSNSKKMTHAALQAISHNSGFESGSLGTKGGRVIVYLKPDGSIAKAVTPVDVTQQTLGATDHSNEEIIRVHNCREFGSGRSNDFSTLRTSNQDTYSVLEDDATALVGFGVSHGTFTAGVDGIGIDDPNDFMVIHFIGSGLDVSRFETATGNETMEYYLDGTLLSSAAEAGFGKTRTFKLASGLSYGEHIIRIRKLTQVNWSLYIQNYKIYGPKKPTLPNGAVELAEYYIPGNFVANATAGVDYIGSGLIRKFANREFNYSGSGFSLATQNVGFPGGVDVSSPVAGNFFEVTFFGTGFVRNVGNPDNAIVQIDANGVALNTTNYPTMVSSTFGSVSFVPSTGVMTDTSGPSSPGLNISNLPLGLYTIRCTNTNGGGNGMQTNSFDIITPIHAPKINKQFALQNTLNVGSQGLIDSRESSIHSDLSESKNIAQCGSTQTPNSSVTNFHPVPDMQLAIFCRSKKLRINWTIDAYNGSGAIEIEFQICVNGVKVGEIFGNAYGNQLINHDSIMVPVQPGWQNVTLLWKTVSSTMQAIGHGMTVEEA